jgi:hypothetical protein
MMSNLDRFSSPLASERVNPYHMEQIHEELCELNKKHIIDAFISNYWENVGLVPDAEMIQETFYKIDLDMDLINERLNQF